jgi:hypothetical protein
MISEKITMPCERQSHRTPKKKIKVFKQSADLFGRGVEQDGLSPPLRADLGGRYPCQILGNVNFIENLTTLLWA